MNCYVTFKMTWYLMVWYFIDGMTFNIVWYLNGMIFMLMVSFYELCSYCFIHSLIYIIILIMTSAWM